MRNSIIRYIHPRSASLFPVLASHSPWTGLEGEIDRLFESALSDFSVPSLFADQRFPVDIYEDKDNTYVRAELPGVNRDEINVEMVDEYLNVSATRKSQGEKGEEASFALARSIAIPEAVQADKVSAAYENGVLTVTLPKREEAKPRKITVAVK
ncbi:MAG: Hsp20/alpha crystallin family protein [Opitutaceae bacterium]|nr:Hsp20/alpha crystallin family protein [Opitutaceae bacterium]